MLQSRRAQARVVLAGIRVMLIICAILCLSCSSSVERGSVGVEKAGRWRIGRPIVTYWAGPPMTEATAKQMAEGGWNLVWCRENEMDVAHRYGLRCYLHDPLLNPKNLDTPAETAKLDALIERVRNHPALYAYHLKDEPGVSMFPDLGRLVSHLRERDPAHLAYINLYPTYANLRQLGTQGDTVSAYTEYLRRFVEVFRPDLISYDHYHFATTGDGKEYFLNLALIRQAALDANVPFLNIIQACSWTPSMRIPNGDELRWLVYTSLAYGAQGISYYVYCHPKHNGAMALADGTPTPLYHAAKVLNREFAAIATELQGLRSLGAYHVGMTPPGAQPLPEKAAFQLDPPVPAMEYKPPQPVRGFVLGFFGESGARGGPERATHALVVNLDYKQSATIGLTGRGRIETFDATTGKWSGVASGRLELTLPPGGGKLARVSPE